MAMLKNGFVPVLKPSPNLTNINEIYQDKDSTLSIASKSQLDYNVSNHIISEEPEEQDEISYQQVDQGSISTASSSESSEPFENVTIPRSLSDSSSHIFNTAVIDPKVQQVAKEIFTQSYKEVTPNKYTEFLGTNDFYNISVCHEFMKLFSPWPISLVGSLRIICSKLYLVGESVQIDQVLEIFSKSWCQTNPKNNIGDYKVVHIICFAILILNSDLHNEQNSETKFSKDEFVTNTWDALEEDNSAVIQKKTIIEPFLRTAYDSIASQRLQLLEVTTPSEVNPQNMKRRTIGRRLAPLTNKKDTLTNVSVRSHKHSRRLSSFGSTLSLALTRTPTNSTIATESNYEIDYQKDDYDDRLEKLGSPWMVEGMLKSEVPTNSKKITKGNWFSRLTNTSQVSSDLDLYNTDNWKQCLVIVQKGLLRQHAFGSSAERRSFAKTGSNTVLTYSLYSATASLIEDQIISNTHKKTNGIPWMLTLPNLLSNDYNEDKKVVYYASAIEVATHFVDTCNFWAARITSIPSTEDKIVTNAEFGWGKRVLNGTVDLNKVEISKWECLLSSESSLIPSPFSLEEQFAQLDFYVTSLERAIEEHNQLKSALKHVWDKNELKDKFDRSMTNWSEKYVYLFRQKEKYTIYREALSSALGFKLSQT